MIPFITRRLIQAIFIVLIVSLLVFLVMRLLPGDPILMYLSQEQTQTLSAEQIQQIKIKFGLDKPLMMQYVNWVGNLFHGDFGASLFYRENVSQLLAKRIPVTLHLGLIAFVLSNFLGISAGVVSALRRGKTIDLTVTILANIGITIPAFWLGILLIYAFAFKLGWLPIQGYTSPFDDFWLSTKQIIMPVICLALFVVGAAARQTRSSILEVLHQDYVRTAWSKGLTERTLVTKHVLKNGLIPIVTLAGMHIGSILGGGSTHRDGVQYSRHGPAGGRCG
jgi:peptide/nickel transport system permease protein